ncbi:MAG: hypothetical protein DRQ44_03640 [Gammaproteobacteria bacterium]|nr:MAG: hypothetical protein DRQ44_03640 [Gammaproteobacteria bacterium]
MNHTELSSERLIALFVLGVFLFTPPFLFIFDYSTLIAGIPALFLYLFVAWAVVITLMMLLVEQTDAD